MPIFVKGSASDTLYVQFSDMSIHESVELHPDVIVDVDVNGTVVGIDLQNVTELIADAEQLKGVAGINVPSSTEGAYSLPSHADEAVNPGRLVFVAA